MKSWVIGLFAAAALAPAVAATNVGISIDVAQPGVYGRIDIGNVRPAVVMAQPIIVTQPRVVVHQQPVYLYVPPGHQKKWHKHCASYGACGQPVYFVQETWVREQHQRHGKHDGKGKNKGKHGRD
jgi:hypothetical protein